MESRRRHPLRRRRERPSSWRACGRERAASRKRRALRSSGRMVFDPDGQRVRRPASISSAIWELQGRLQVLRLVVVPLQDELFGFRLGRDELRARPLQAGKARRHLGSDRRRQRSPSTERVLTRASAWWCLLGLVQCGVGSTGGGARLDSIRSPQRRLAQLERQGSVVAELVNRASVGVGTAQRVVILKPRASPWVPGSVQEMRPEGPRYRRHGRLCLRLGHRAGR
jgi:hypothetical protein